jgi:uncharacterized membrane-anchored protein
VKNLMLENWLRPKDLLRRLYVTVAVVAVLPAAVIVLLGVTVKVLGVMPLVLTAVVVGLWWLVFRRGVWRRKGQP